MGCSVIQNKWHGHPVFTKDTAAFPVMDDVFRELTDCGGDIRFMYRDPYDEVYHNDLKASVLAQALKIKPASAVTNELEFAENTANPDSIDAIIEEHNDILEQDKAAAEEAAEEATSSTTIVTVTGTTPTPTATVTTFTAHACEMNSATNYQLAYRIDTDNSDSDSGDNSDGEQCQFCGNRDLMSPNVETLVTGFGYCQFCCMEQRSHQCTYNDNTGDWLMKGDTIITTPTDSDSDSSEDSPECNKCGETFEYNALNMVYDIQQAYIATEDNIDGLEGDLCPACLRNNASAIFKYHIDTDSPGDNGECITKSNLITDAKEQNEHGDLFVEVSSSTLGIDEYGKYVKMNMYGAPVKGYILNIKGGYLIYRDGSYREWNWTRSHGYVYGRMKKFGDGEDEYLYFIGPRMACDYIAFSKFTPDQMSLIDEDSIVWNEGFFDKWGSTLQSEMDDTGWETANSDGEDSDGEDSDSGRDRCYCNPTFDVRCTCWIPDKNTFKRCPQRLSTTVSRISDEVDFYRATNEWRNMDAIKYHPDILKIELTTSEWTELKGMFAQKRREDYSDSDGEDTDGEETDSDGEDTDEDTAPVAARAPDDPKMRMSSTDSAVCAQFTEDYIFIPMNRAFPKRVSKWDNFYALRILKDDTVLEVTSEQHITNGGEQPDAVAEGGWIQTGNCGFTRPLFEGESLYLWTYEDGTPAYYDYEYLDGMRRPVMTFHLSTDNLDGIHLNNQTNPETILKPGKFTLATYENVQAHWDSTIGQPSTTNTDNTDSDGSHYDQSNSEPTYTLHIESTRGDSVKSASIVPPANPTDPTTIAGLKILVFDDTFPYHQQALLVDGEHIKFNDGEYVHKVIAHNSKVTSIKNCSICDSVILGYGHNAYPYKGRCCGKCNDEDVLAARLSLIDSQRMMNQDETKAAEEAQSKADKEAREVEAREVKEAQAKADKEAREAAKEAAVQSNADKKTRKAVKAEAERLERERVAATVAATRVPVSTTTSSTSPQSTKLSAKAEVKAMAAARALKAQTKADKKSAKGNRDN